jgi:eukaryotic-like serine/threonine-protein kinase
VRLQHENAPIPVEGLPPALRSLARSGLAKSPSARPADASVLLTALEDAARSGYGDDWEERGRAKLARRVALLALLLPFGAPAIGGSALARTLLGPGRMAFAAGLLAVLLAGGISATALSSSDSTTGPPTAVTPPPPPPAVPSVTLTPDPAPVEPSSEPPTSSAGPASTTHSTTTTTTTTTTAAQPPPPPPPPPPAVVVQKLSITSFAYQGGGSTVVEAHIHVQTTNTSPATLTLTFAGSNVFQKAGSYGPVVHTFVLSGATSYDRVDTLDAGKYSCAALYVGVQASTSPPAQGGGPYYADVNAPPC